MRRTHLIERNSQKTLCGKPKKVKKTDFVDNNLNWFSCWFNEGIKDYLKQYGYCDHCIRIFLLIRDKKHVDNTKRMRLEYGRKKNR